MIFTVIFIFRNDQDGTTGRKRARAATLTNRQSEGVNLEVIITLVKLCVIRKLVQHIMKAMSYLSLDDDEKNTPTYSVAVRTLKSADVHESRGHHYSVDAVCDPHSVSCMGEHNLIYEMSS